MITTEQIKKLRDETGISVMQCHKALEEAGGDEAKAKAILKVSSRLSAEKKASRTLGSGTVAAYIHSNGLVGTMVELLCETDFVAINEEFKALAKNIAMHVTAMDPENTEELLAQEFIKDSSVTIAGLVEQAIQKFGERTEIGQFTRLSIK